ncbi:MAG: hypothetical protein IJS99_07270 [Synergistaceae bacterium]|nr:hypothetical protein [Synergistaceae bacterium]
MSLLGVNNKYTAPANQNNSNVEIFAISQREISGLDKTFIYTTPHLSNLTKNSSDNEEPEDHDCVNINISNDEQITNQISGDKSDILPPEFTREDFNRNRVKDFLQWVVSLDILPDNKFNSSTED